MAKKLAKNNNTGDDDLVHQIGPVTLLLLGTLYFVQLTSKVQDLWDAFMGFGDQWNQKSR